MAGLRFGVLGPLEVWRDGEPVSIPRGRRRAVLACLLVHVGHTVTADALVEAAWGDELPAEPRTAVHTVLSRLRHVLGAGAVRSEPAGYRLDVSAEAVDAIDFEALRARAVVASAEESRRLLDRALALWRGPAYAEFADRSFAATEAQRLDLRRLDTIEARAALFVDDGEVGEAIVELESLLAEHPFREHALQLLMTALYRAGRPTDALTRYRDYRAMLAEELGLDPSPALRDLEARILGHDLPPPRRPAAALSPLAWLDTSTAFVGRDQVLSELVEGAASNRVLTVTGVGGVGKTRLVAQALPLLGEHLAVPVTIVELAPVRPGHVAGAVAEALGLRRLTGSERAGVVEYLSIADGVLVLDNCEHLLTELASLVDVIVNRCPRIRVVATSRHRLGMPSELVLPLEPLPVPDVDEVGERGAFNASVRLFFDRVRRVRPTFGLTEENLPVIADVCRRLDGIPLALELAASRAAVLGPGPVREWLDQDLALPEQPDVLRAVMDWSYRLLSPAERRLLALLSVFAAHFDVEAVNGLASALDLCNEGRGVAEPLAELVDSSLLSVYDVDGQTRYRMLTIVRSFAAERLAGSGAADDAHLAHATWIRDLVEQAATDLTGSGSAAACARLSRSRADIDSAVRWALAADHLPLAAAITGAVGLFAHAAPDMELSDLVVDVARRCAKLARPGPALAVAAGGHALAYRGESGGGVELALTALRWAETPAERFLTFVALGVAALHTGELDESIRWWRKITTAEDLPLAYRANGHISHAVLACYRGDVHTARHEADIALASAEATGAAVEHAFALYAAGEVAAYTDMDNGARLLGEAVVAADRAGAGYVSQIARLARLAALVRLNRHDEALALATPLVHDERRAGLWPQLWTTMRILAELLAAGARDQDAAFLLAAAEAAEAAPPLSGEDVRRYDRLDADLRDRLGDELVDRISVLARGVPRTQVLDRNLTILGKLSH